MSTALPSRAPFDPTRWSLVLEAGGARSRSALEELCRAYWPPVYAFLRRRGHDREAAEEHTQAFFCALLEGTVLERADPARGRFRSYLLGCLAHFVADRARLRARERAVDLDPEAVEASLIAAGDASPEAAFERAWAQLVLERAFERVRADHAARGDEAFFEALRPTLSGEPLAGGYAALASALGRSENALRVAAHRLRRRLAEELEREVRETVGPGCDVGAEVAHLARALAAASPPAGEDSGPDR